MYRPTDEILEKYADVLINFALGSTKGIKEGDIVLLKVPQCARPMLKHLIKAVLKAGGHPLIDFLPELDRVFLENASDEQIKFFPDKYYRGLVDQVDHVLRIDAREDKQEMKGIPAEKIIAKQHALKPFKEWYFDKEYAGKLTWTIGLYGTESMAQEAHMSLEEYWREIINACFLEETDPVQKWREVNDQITSVKEKLNELQIKKVHVISENTDLWVTIGEKRKWLAGRGANIPSFEVFTSPDWRGTNGHIQFTEPLYRHGTLIKDAYLEFKDGKVVKATASVGEDILKEMIAVENGDKIGEFSLTDRRFSKITKFMGETLYDENVGGEFGNSHIALGMSYRDAFDGDPTSLTKEDLKDLGFNDCSLHTDIVTTEDKKVIAETPSGEMVIYEGGEFKI